MTKQPITPLPIPTTCNNCNIEERWFLHHVRHRSIFRKLCTNCVLRLHTQSFCPTCYLVYNPTPPPPPSLNGLVSCVKCYSYSHNSCVGPNPPHPYLCPLCVNPNAVLFNLKKGKDVGLDNDGDRDCRVVDMKAAKVLLTAAKIASGSINKAALAARVEAERRAKEAAFTRKRAREALEHLAYLTARDKMMKKRDVLPLPSNGTALVAGNVHNRGSNQCLSMVVAAVPLEEENVVNNADRLDGSSEVLVALNAVDLKGQNPIVGLPAGSNGSAMDVEGEKAEELLRENGQTEMVNDGMVNSNAGKPNGSVRQL